MCVPTLRDEDREMPADDWIRDFSSGYIQRKIHLLPKQGNRWPWTNSQNYLSDRKTIGEGPIDDGVLRFSDPAIKTAPGREESHAA